MMNLNPFGKRPEKPGPVARAATTEDDFEVNPESANQNESADEKVPQAQIDDALLDILADFAPEMVTPEERARKTKGQQPKK